MALENQSRTGQGSEPDDAVEVVVLPVVVSSRSFAARPSSLPDAHAFVRAALSSATVEAPAHAEITRAIHAALLAAASPAIGTFVVVVRLFPDEAEVEVLSSTDPSAPADQAGTSHRPSTLPDAIGGSFATWLASMIRQEGLSQEAAARQLGVSVRTVSRWVRGQTEPRLRDVRRINEVFGPVPHR